MADNSLRLVEDCDIVMGHIFPFSPKRGTPAARMPQVPPVIAKERARKLREACARQRVRWLEGLVGTRQRVLLEKNDFGHAENFAPVRIALPPDGGGLGGGGLRDPRSASGDLHPTPTPPHQGEGLPGAIVDVMITSVEPGILVGAAA
jgi:hypothetical protein